MSKQLKKLEQLIVVLHLQFWSYIVGSSYDSYEQGKWEFGQRMEKLRKKKDLEVAKGYS